MDVFKYRLGYLTRESVILPHDDQQMISLPHQIKQTSPVIIQENEKSKRKVSTYRLSLIPKTKQVSNPLTLMKKNKSKSINGNHLSISKQSLLEEESKNEEMEQHLREMKVDEEEMYEEDNPKILIEENESSSKIEEINEMKLEDKLAKDHGFDLIGIMNLSSMNLTDDDIPLVLQRAFSKKCKRFFGLILRDNHLTSKGVKILVETFLTKRTNLKYLNFSDNPNIGDEGMEHLSRFIQQNRTMTFLAISNTGITDQSIKILSNILSHHNNQSSCAPLEKLYLSFNNLITDQSFEDIQQILQHNQTLQVLSVRNCQFSSKIRRKLTIIGTKMKKRKFSLVE